MARKKPIRKKSGTGVDAGKSSGSMDSELPPNSSATPMADEEGSTNVEQEKEEDLGLPSNSFLEIEQPSSEIKRHSSDSKGDQGPGQKPTMARLIADEKIEFVASIAEKLETYIGQWSTHDEGKAPRWCNNDGTRMKRKYFEFNFGVRAKDGNVYPFTLTLFRLEKWWPMNRLGNGNRYWECGDFVILWPKTQHSITAEVEVTIDHGTSGVQTFGYTESFEEGGTKNPDFGNGDPSRPGDGDGPHRWRVSYLEYIRKKKSKIPPKMSDLICKVGAKIKIYKNEDLKLQDEHVGNFTIACSYYDERNNQDRFEEFQVDRNMLDERSSLLKSMGSKKSKKGQPNKIILDGIDARTFEAFRTFCKTGYFPLWAIDATKSKDGDLVTLADKYNLTEITDLVDKYVGMTVTAENAHAWVDWCVKLDLKNVALHILARKKVVSEAVGKRKKKVVKKINGVKPEEIEWTNFCKEHQRFIEYLGNLTGIVDGLVPNHGRFEDLINFTENIMVN